MAKSALVRGCSSLDFCKPMPESWCASHRELSRRASRTGEQTIADLGRDISHGTGTTGQEHSAGASRSRKHSIYVSL